MNEEISTYRRLPNFVKKMMVLLDFVLAGRVVVDVLMIFFFGNKAILMTDFD